MALLAFLRKWDCEHTIQTFSYRIIVLLCQGRA